MQVLNICTHKGLLLDKGILLMSDNFKIQKRNIVGLEGNSAVISSVSTPVSEEPKYHSVVCMSHFVVSQREMSRRLLSRHAMSFFLQILEEELLKGHLENK